MISGRRCIQSLPKAIRLVSSTTSSSTDYLHYSLVPTDHFQASLPRLPLPALQQTCHKYLNAVQPLVSHEQFEKTSKIVNEFLNGEGQDLHKQLLLYDEMNPDKNYVSDYWDDSYLMGREPLVLGTSVGFAEIDTSPSGSQAIEATNFIVAALKYVKTFEEGILEPYHTPMKASGKVNNIRLMPEMHKCTEELSPLKTVMPFCMARFKHMFKASRIPAPEKDLLETYPDSKHIVVLKDGHFYSFNVLSDTGSIIPGAEILAHIQYIQSEKRPLPTHPVSVLTTDHRDTWLQARQQLINDGNETVLSAIDSAIMLVVLDDDPSDQDATIRASLHGHGHNRWYDKPYNHVFTTSGGKQTLFEHAWGDGATGVHMRMHTKHELKHNPSVNTNTKPAQCDSSLAVKRLEFKLSDGIKSQIEDSMKRFQTAIDEVDLRSYHYTQFGSKLIKQNSISPDSLIQLGFQLAYRRLFNQTACTYESCTTSAFKLGRTETMRPATMLTNKLCEMILGGGQYSMQEVRDTLKESSKMHGKLVAEASVGQGCDRHLYAMYKLSMSQGTVPAIFQDPSFAHSMTFRLSTTTMGMLFPSTLASFAPVVPDGYGIYYLVGPDFIRGAISSFKKHKDVPAFMEALTTSLDDLSTVMEKQPS